MLCLWVNSHADVGNDSKACRLQFPALQTDLRFPLSLHDPVTKPASFEVNQLYEKFWKPLMSKLYYFHSLSVLKVFPRCNYMMCQTRNTCCRGEINPVWNINSILVTFIIWSWQVYIYKWSPCHLRQICENQLFFIFLLKSFF